MAKSGSSVNIICTAESYPPADSVSDYLIKHPHNISIEKELLPEMDGIVHKIVAATKQRDAGEYECSVNVTLDEYPGKPLDSEVAAINLTVYGMLYVHVLHLSLKCSALRCTLDDTSIYIIISILLDSPSILHVCNFTVCLDPDVEQSAILECAVSNTEDNLKVWVNWTTIDGKDTKKEHVTLRKDVFYLLL